MNAFWNSNDHPLEFSQKWKRFSHFTDFIKSSYSNYVATHRNSSTQIRKIFMDHLLLQGVQVWKYHILVHNEKYKIPYTAKPTVMMENTTRINSLKNLELVCLASTWFLISFCNFRSLALSNLPIWKMNYNFRDLSIYANKILFYCIFHQNNKVASFSN